MGEEEETSQHLTSPASFFFSSFYFCQFSFAPWGPDLGARAQECRGGRNGGSTAAQTHPPTTELLEQAVAKDSKTRNAGPGDDGACSGASPLRNVFTAYAGVS